MTRALFIPRRRGTSSSNYTHFFYWGPAVELDIIERKQGFIVKGRTNEPDDSRPDRRPE